MSHRRALPLITRARSLCVTPPYPGQAFIPVVQGALSHGSLQIIRPALDLAASRLLHALATTAAPTVLRNGRRFCRALVQVRGSLLDSLVPFLFLLMLAFFRFAVLRFWHGRRFCRALVPGMRHSAALLVFFVFFLLWLNVFQIYGGFYDFGVTRRAECGWWRNL